MWVNFIVIAYSQLKMCFFIAKSNAYIRPIGKSSCIYMHSSMYVCMYACTLVHRYVLLILKEWNGYVLNDKFRNSRSLMYILCIYIYIYIYI